MSMYAFLTTSKPERTPAPAIPWRGRLIVVDGLSESTSEDVSASTLHERHEALVSDDLHAAVERRLVEDASSRSHHHSSSDGIDGVGSEARDNGDG